MFYFQVYRHYSGKIRVLSPPPKVPLLKHISHSFLQESLVNTHKLGDERLQMVDGLVSLVNAVLIVGGHVCYFCFQTAVTVGHQFRDQTLQKQERKNENLKVLQ